MTTCSARFSILEVELPGEAPMNAGVMLEDPERNRIYIRVRRDWEDLVPEEAEVLSALQSDLTAKSEELGADKLFENLEATLSNAVRISARREVMVEDFDRALGRLYREHVRSNVHEFKTHLPRYSLAAAAGRFLENQEISAEGWEEAPPGLRLTPEMFVARITGHSMEPAIPHDSLCVFRYDVRGSRHGRLVLVEQLGRGSNDRYAVKRYRSEKNETPDGTWSHARITLDSLNPEFESWDLDPQEDRFRVIAEFVRVLD